MTKYSCNFTAIAVPYGESEFDVEFLLVGDPNADDDAAIESITVERVRPYGRKDFHTPDRRHYMENYDPAYVDYGEIWAENNYEHLLKVFRDTYASESAHYNKLAEIY